MKRKIVSVILVLCLLAVVLPVLETDAMAGYGIYHPELAAAYALRNYSAGNAEWRDYSSAGGDCANFVSQCLYAGGLHMTRDWFWYEATGGSNAWLTTTALATYLTSIGCTAIPDPTVEQVELGDLIFYDWVVTGDEARYDHVSICAAIHAGTPWVCARSDPQFTGDWTMEAESCLLVKLDAPTDRERYDCTGVLAYALVDEPQGGIPHTDPCYVRDGRDTALMGSLRWGSMFTITDYYISDDGRPWYLTSSGQWLDEETVAFRQYLFSPRLERANLPRGTMDASPLGDIGGRIVSTGGAYRLTRVTATVRNLVTGEVYEAVLQPNATTVEDLRGACRSAGLDLAKLPAGTYSFLLQCEETVRSPLLDEDVTNSTYLDGTTFVLTGNVLPVPVKPGVTEAVP